MYAMAIKKCTARASVKFSFLLEGPIYFLTTRESTLFLDYKYTPYEKVAKLTSRFIP